MLVSPGGVGGGATAVIRIAPTASIPLDTAGNGKAMPLVFGNRIVVSTPLVLIAPLFSAMVDGGNCTGNYRVNAAVDDSAFLRSGLPMDIGYDCDVVFVAGIPPRMIVQRGAAVDITAPLLGLPAIANAAPGFIDTPITELNLPTLNGVLAGVTLTGFAGKTATAVAVVGNVLRVTLSVSAVYGDTGTIAFAAGMVRDLNNNQSVVMAATTVANNIAVPVPGAPVVTAGTNALTSVSGTIAAGAGQVPTTYTIFYKTAAAGTYTTGAFVTYTGASTAFSIPGLTAGTSYNVKAQANNAGGASVDSNVITTSTAGVGSLVGATVTLANEDLTAGGWTAWSIVSSSPTGSQDQTLASGTAITGPTLNNVTRTGGPAIGSTISWTAGGTPVAAGSITTTGHWDAVSSASPSAVSFVVPAGVTAKTVRIRCGSYVDATFVGTATLRAHLSDSSAADFTAVVPAVNEAEYEFVFNAASAGQTLTLSVGCETTGKPQIFVGMVAYK